MRSRTNPFVLVAGVYLTAGLVALATSIAVAAGLIDGLPRLRWVTVHLVTIGGLTQAVFGLLPSLLGGDVASTTGSRWTQWLFLNAGYPLVVLGMVTGSATTALAGAAGVLLALALLLATVLGTTGSGPAAEYYRTAPWFLVAGIAAAAGLLLHRYGPGGYVGLLEAHVHANVWGLLGLVVAGALLTLLPPMLGASLRYPRLVPVTFWGLTLGALGLVAGPPLALAALTLAGLAGYLTGTVALLANVVGTARTSGWTQPSRLALVVGAYLWLVAPIPVAPFVLLAPTAVPVGAIEAAAITALVLGWMLQLAMAFLPVMVVATQRPAEESLVERTASAAARDAPSWVQVATLNVGVGLLWLRAVPQLSGSVADLTVGGSALVAVAWLLFVRSFWGSLLTAGEGRRSRVARDSP
ncbi:hypothetical protein NDI56_02020 [Haloarcula sp. S1CR25-12]|uniref:Cytochrome oxidase subunit I profile domain-containing protein n=1 Tax=Haloarcula saliterrae TaxID=2950534 RepID=A0ABU2F7E5_9EURY|nr:hypothetical protein [Haloarcula sp. S1CR25-12]MDS0258182.1 hypothetical protein [Haloarcula sp. S1CR25-12]